MVLPCDNCNAFPPNDVTVYVKEDDDYDRDTIVVSASYCPRCGKELHP